MTNENEEFEPLQKKEEHLQKWLDNYKSASDIAPHVQSELETTKWQIGALRDRPEEASEIPLSYSAEDSQLEYEHTRDSLPMMPQYDRDAFYNSTGTASSGTISVQEFVFRVGQLPTESARDYSRKYQSQFRVLKATKDRPQQVRQLIQDKLGSQDTLQRFDRAKRAYSDIKIGVGGRTSAANEMRNLLEGVQGDLWELARYVPHEKMNWETMAKRLSEDGMDSIGYRSIIGQETVRAKLFDQLSKVAKDYEGQQVNNIDQIWTKLLLHIYGVLTQIR